MLTEGVLTLFTLNVTVKSVVVVASETFAIWGLTSDDELEFVCEPEVVPGLSGSSVPHAVSVHIAIAAEKSSVMRFFILLFIQCHVFCMGRSLS